MCPFSLHYNQIARYVLEIQSTSFIIVVAITMASTASNKAFVRTLAPVFLLFYRQYLNFVTKVLLSNRKHSIESIHKLMSKLFIQISAAEQWVVTPLTAQTREGTQWSLTYTLLLTFIKQQEFIVKLELPDIDDLVLDDKVVEDLDALMCDLNNIKSLTQTSQDESPTLPEASALFAEVFTLQRFPKPRLGLRAGIIEN